MISLPNSDLWQGPPMGAFIKSLCFLLIVYLLAFIIVSYEALTVYIKTCLTASTSAQAKPQSLTDGSKTVEPITPARKWRLALGGIVFTGLAVVQYIILLGNSQFDEILLNLFGSLLYFTLVFIVGKVAFSMSTTFVTRGSPLVTPLIVFLAAGIIFSAILMPLGLYGSNNALSAWTVTLSLVYFVSDTQLSKAPRWKHVCGYWAYYAFVIFTNMYNFKTNATENQSQDVNGEEIWPRITFQGLYVAFLPAALASFGSGNLIARMLRLDFKNYLDKNELVVRRPEDINNPRGLLISVGSDLFTIRFPKPYFTVAIAAWSFVRIVIIGLCLTTGFPAKSPYDACFYTAFVESLVMVAAIFLLGVVRGETKVLRDYEEHWPKPNQAAQGDVKTTANDEKV